MLTHTYPHKPLRKIEVAVVYDTEYPYCDQASLNNTKTQTLTSAVEIP